MQYHAMERVGVKGMGHVREYCVIECDRDASRT